MMFNQLRYGRRYRRCLDELYAMRDEYPWSHEFIDNMIMWAEVNKTAITEVDDRYVASVRANAEKLEEMWIDIGQALDAEVIGRA